VLAARQNARPATLALDSRWPTLSLPARCSERLSPPRSPKTLPLQSCSALWTGGAGRAPQHWAHRGRLRARAHNERLSPPLNKIVDRGRHSGRWIRPRGKLATSGGRSDQIVSARNRSRGVSCPGRLTWRAQFAVPRSAWGRQETTLDGCCFASIRCAPSEPPQSAAPSGSS